MAHKHAEPAPLGPGTLVFAYGRVSGHPHQDKSLSEQRAELMDFAARNEYTIVQWFEDSGSGTSTDHRPEFLRMIAACHRQPPPVRAVLLWRRDRFARNEDDDPFYAADLRKHGVEPISVTNPLPDGPYKRLLESIDAHTAAKYISKLREDTMRGQSRSTAEGHPHIPTLPVGYKPVDDPASHWRQPLWAIDEATAPLVLRAWQMRATGYSLSEIHRATHLHRSIQGYARMFRHGRCYLGIATYAGTEYPGVVPAIVPQDVYDKVQALAPAPPRGVTSDYLFSGIIVCGVCGAKMAGHARRIAWAGTVHAYRYYLCMAKQSGDYHGCPSRGLRADELEADVLERIAATCADPEHVAAMFAAARQAQDATDDQAELERMERDLARLSRASSDLFDLAGTERWPEARKRIAALDAQATGIEQQRDELQERTRVLDLTPELAHQYARQIGENLASDDFRTRQLQVRRIVERITVTSQTGPGGRPSANAGFDGTAAIEYKPPQNWQI